MKKLRSNPRSASLADIHLGDKIRERRLALHMSQEQLGRELGLSFQQVQKYEKGSNRVSAARLYEICQVLAVSIDSMFQGIPIATRRSRPGAPGEKPAKAKRK
jgi:transcriptional regulator with XRE-family HTH domain